MNSNSIYKSEEGKKRIMSLYDKLLSKWPEKYTTFNVSTRQGDKFVMKCGNVSQGSLTLLHGAGSNLTSWIGEISSYSKYFNVCTSVAIRASNL